MLLVAVSGKKKKNNADGNGQRHLERASIKQHKKYTRKKN
jgi:hypothetical protein